MASDLGHALPPPADLASRTIPTTPVGGCWFRIGKTSLSPLYYSQNDGWRFSAPSMPGTLYLGDTEETCFWEVFWDDLVSRPVDERRLDEAKVRERSLWKIELPRDFNLIDTTDPDTLNALGAHGGTFLGPYPICQQWAAALRSGTGAPGRPRPDGLIYESSRRKGRKCLALFSEHTSAEGWSDPGTGIPLPESDALSRLLLAHHFQTLRSDY